MEIACALMPSVPRPRITDFCMVQFTLVSDQYYVSQVKELHAEISVVVTPTISISLHSSTTAVKSTNFDIMGQSTTC